MSTQYVNFSKASPVKWYKNTATPGGHMEDDWAFNRIKVFESGRRYPQRWQVGDTTTLQMYGTIPPDDLKIYNCRGVVVHSIVWTAVFTGAGFTVYQLTLNLTAAGIGTFYLYQKNELMLTKFEAISEPIEVRTVWPKTAVFEYKNSFDTFGTFFTTGIKFRFRVEAGIMDYEPANESAEYIDELHNGELLSSTVYDTFKLYIGDAYGVPDWVLKLLNFIIHCDNWKVEIKNQDALQYVKIPGEKWDINRIKNWTGYGASIAIMPAENAYALQMAEESINPGIVTGYNLNTNFFGTSVSEIQIEEIDIIE